MGPFLPLIISLAEELLQQEPEIAAQIAAIFTKQNPTPADWMALHQQVLAKSYADYVPASALPPSPPAVENPVITTPPAESNALQQPPGAPQEAAKAPEPPYLADGSKNPAHVE